MNKAKLLAKLGGGFGAAVGGGAAGFAAAFGGAKRNAGSGKTIRSNAPVMALCTPACMRFVSCSDFILFQCLFCYCMTLLWRMNGYFQLSILGGSWVSQGGAAMTTRTVTTAATGADSDESSDSDVSTPRLIEEMQKAPRPFVMSGHM